MERFSRMLRSGLAMVLALCMIVSACPIAAFAAENEVVYVSLGDSMANGYGMVGYNQNGSGTDYDFKTGHNMYGNGAYPNKFEDYLEGKYGNVQHIKLATSGMVAPDMLYLLGGVDAPVNDAWHGYADYVGNYSDGDVRSHFQDSVKKADIISLGIGNGSFGAYLMNMLTNLVGMNPGGATPNVSLSDALALVKDGDESMKQLLQNLYSSLRSKLVAAGAGTGLPVEQMCDVMIYAAASHLVGLKGVLEQIDVLNDKDDLEVILVGLSNNLAGVKIGGVDIGSAMDALFNALNAYLAGLPTAMQAAGKLEGITFYYAGVMHPQFISEIFVDMYDDGEWSNETYKGVMDVDTMRIRTINAVATYVIANVVNKETAAAAKYANGFINQILKGNIQLNENNASQFVMTGVYLGIEKAVATNISTKDIPMASLTNMTKLKDVLGEALDLDQLAAKFQDAVSNGSNAGVQAVADEVYNVLNSGDFRGMCTLFGLTLVGDGMAAHPSKAGHASIAAKVISAYENGHTAEEETKENIEYVLGELKGFLETYGPEAAEQLWNIWVENGYQEKVDDMITELTDILGKRYEDYTTNVLPAIETAIGELTAQKTALTTELNTLKDQLAAKKAELEKVISEQEISSITPPDINIDVELGNNEQTQVPDNTCPGTGNVEDELEAAVKDLEHAISVIEALIADVTADIEDMVALAEQIAEAIAALEETMADVAAAAEDLKEAFDAIVEVLTNESAQATSQTFINAFNTARDMVLTASDALELIIETVGEDFAAIEESVGVLEEGITALYNQFTGDGEGNYEDVLTDVINLIPEDTQKIIGATAIMIQQTLEENQEEINTALEAAKQEVMTKLATDLGELEKEYGPKIAEAQTALNAKLTEIQTEIDKRYQAAADEATAQIEALKLEAQGKLNDLNTELQGYMTELEGLAADAAQEVRDGIQAQIDRVNGDIATVTADLECAIEHVNTELKAAYDAIVEEVNGLYSDIVEELQNAYDALVKAYEDAVKALKDAADNAIQDLIKDAEQAIKDLIDAANKELEKLGKLGEILSDALDGIFEAIRDDIANAQDAIEDILNGTLEAVKDLAESLVDMGIDAIESLVDQITEMINDLLYQATHSDLELNEESIYVALGDGSAAPESYVGKLAAVLEAEYGVTKVTNYAEKNNTVSAETAKVAKREGIADADLITVGFSNVDMLANALENMRTQPDWSKIVGAENVSYVDEIMAEVEAEIIKAIPDETLAGYAGKAVEWYAYNAVEYAVELPALISEIRSVNEDGVIIIVGQYNPMEDVIISIEGIDLDISEYVDYFVDAVAVHGTAYALISGDAIYVDAPDVDVNKPGTIWGKDMLMGLIGWRDVSAMYPGEEGDVYVANQILGALNITKIPVEVKGLWGDADGDGTVDSYDATLVARYDVGNIGANALNLAVCDVDGDGVVDSYDATLIARYDVGKITVFPVEQ